MINVIAKSSDGRVYVVFANESLSARVGRASKLAKRLKMDAEVKEEPYTAMYDIKTIGLSYLVKL